jgi:hypothetical protein
MRGRLFDLCSQSVLVSAGAANVCSVAGAGCRCRLEIERVRGCTTARLHEFAPAAAAPAHQRDAVDDRDDTATLKFTEKRRHVMRKYFNLKLFPLTKPPTNSERSQRPAQPNQQGGSKQALLHLLQLQPLRATQSSATGLPVRSVGPVIQVLPRCVLAGASESVCV